MWCDAKANLTLIRDSLRSQSVEDIDLVALPETSLTGFAVTLEMQPLKSFRTELAELGLWAKETSTSILLGAFLDEETFRSNAVIFISGDTGEATVAYRKIHLFTFAEEQKVCSAGSSLGILELKNIALGMAICFDLRSVDLFSKYRASDVEIMLVIANWPATRQDHFTALLKARALDMQFAVIGLNRSGKDPIVGQYDGTPVGFYADGSPMDFARSNQFSIVEMEKAELCSRSLELMKGFYD